MVRKGECHIGTSGWHYDHWVGPFYPSNTPKAKFLTFYADHFQSAEINNTFYNLPEERTLRDWTETVPNGFVFSVKASRFITHNKNLKDPRVPTDNFLRRLEALGDRLGPILFQLPPYWQCNAERLRAFFDQAPEGAPPFVFEFRNETWWNDEIDEILHENGAAFCIFDIDRRLSPKKTIGDLVYIRLHGPDQKYTGLYDKTTLSGWAGAISAWMRQGKDVFCYFDNDQRGYAAQNAQELQEMLHSP